MGLRRQLKEKTSFFSHVTNCFNKDPSLYSGDSLTQPTYSHHYSSSYFEFEIYKKHMKTFSWETFKQYTIILPIQGNRTKENILDLLSLEEVYSRWQPNECVRSARSAAESLEVQAFPWYFRLESPQSNTLQSATGTKLKVFCQNRRI